MVTVRRASITGQRFSIRRAGGLLRRVIDREAGDNVADSTVAIPCGLRAGRCFRGPWWSGEVATEPAAELKRSLGSPTVRVDAIDVEPSAMPETAWAFAAVSTNRVLAWWGRRPTIGSGP